MLLCTADPLTQALTPSFPSSQCSGGSGGLGPDGVVSTKLVSGLTWNLVRPLGTVPDDQDKPPTRRGYLWGGQLQQKKHLWGPLFMETCAQDMSEWRRYVTGGSLHPPLS